MFDSQKQDKQGTIWRLLQPCSLKNLDQIMKSTAIELMDRNRRTWKTNSLTSGNSLWIDQQVEFKEVLQVCRIAWPRKPCHGYDYSCDGVKSELFNDVAREMDSDYLKIVWTHLSPRAPCRALIRTDLFCRVLPCTPTRKKSSISWSTGTSGNSTYTRQWISIQHRSVAATWMRND